MFVIGNPWGLLALGAIPAILGLHFFRRRFRPLEIAGLFLWPPGDTLPPAGRKLRRIDAPVSLFLEILAALFLAGLVAGLRWEERADVPHLVVVLDHSASMAATDAAGERAADRALRVVTQACEERGPLASVRLSVILSGPRPVVVVGPVAPADRGVQDLRSWRPALPGHSFGPALELAHRLADAGGQIVLVTDQPDRAAGQVGKGVRVVGVGKPLANAAITVAERTPDAARGGSAVFLRVANFSLGPLDRAVTLRDGEGTALAREMLRLDAGGEASVTWSVPAGRARVWARIEGKDALGLDDEVVLSEPRLRPVRVRCDFAKNSREREKVEKAARSAPLTRWLEEGEADVVVAGAIPDAKARGAAWHVAIGPAPEPLRGGEKLDPLVGPYFADPAAPLMEQLDFRGVIWSGAAPLKPDAPVAVLLSASDVPLVFQWLDGGPPAYVVGLELDRSNVHKSPAWPMLFHNLVGLRREALPGLRRWNFRQGEAVRCRVEKPGEFRILDPAGKDLPIVRLRDGVETFDTWKPGVYTILERGAPVDAFAVNFLDGRESDLRDAHDAAPARADESAAQATLEQAVRWPWLDPGLCALVLALVLLDLLALRRKQPSWVSP
jgi:hypothetical protein